jgi:hypothetical protein
VIASQVSYSKNNLILFVLCPQVVYMKEEQLFVCVSMDIQIAEVPRHFRRLVANVPLQSFGIEVALVQACQLP